VRLNFLRKIILKTLFCKQRKEIADMVHAYNPNWHSTVTETQRCAFEAERTTAKKILELLEGKRQEKT
jgi:hypothetical protein